MQKDSETAVRAQAAVALGNYVLRAEFQQLNSADGKRVEEALHAVVDNQDEQTEVRARALESASARSAAWVRRSIEEAYDSANQRMRLSAVHSMGRHCDPRWLPILMRELRSDDAEMRFEAATACAALGGEAAVPELVELVEDEYPEVQEAVRTGRPVFVADVQTHPLFVEARARWAEQHLRVQVRSVLAIPVALQEHTAGVFLLRTRRSDAPLTLSRWFAETITTAAARPRDRERRSSMYRRLAGVSAHDPLTGCGTLDALDRRIREEFERARRYALSFSLILLDVDQLRGLNERLGQEGGDRVLAELGRLLQRQLRAPDFVSRYGGDEFALILPETDLEAPGGRCGGCGSRSSPRPSPTWPRPTGRGSAPAS
jgi:GAF domain-containing protein